MIIKSETCKNEGIIREAVKCGFGDLRVIVENEEIKTFKFILYVCNETFRKLFDDPFFEEPLKLYDECSKESYLMLEKYYQGIEIEITEKNCVDLLAICVCYNENKIISALNDYVINHLNENIVVDLLSKKEILRSENLKELKEEFEYFLKNENYKIVKNELLNYISIDNLAQLFSLGVMFNGSEVELLRLLIGYYNHNLNNSKVEEEMKRIIERCSFDPKLQNELNDEEKKVLNNLNISLNVNANEKYSIRYYSLPEVKNVYFYDFLMHYNPEEDIPEILFNKSHLVLLKSEDISSDIDKLLKEGNIRIIMLILQLYDGLYMKFDADKYSMILDIILNTYTNINNEDKRMLLMMQIKKFITDDDDEKNDVVFEKVKEKCGIVLLYKLLKDEKILGYKRYSSLLKYMHKFRLDDAECRLLDSTVEDEETKKKIKYHKLKSISYSDDRKNYNGDCWYSSCYHELNCKFIIGDKIDLKPIIDNIIDVESITIEPELPSGLSFDQNTGIVSGKASECITKKYTIAIKNVHGSKKVKIDLTIKRKNEDNKSSAKRYRFF